MSALAELGAEVHGFEPYGYRVLRERGLTAYAGFTEIPAGMKFDCIISMDVVEHLPAPWETMTALRLLVRPGGCLSISTPNPDSLAARVSGGEWREMKNPGHILFMNETTMTRLLGKAGFRRVRPTRWNIRYRPGLGHAAAQWALRRAGLAGAARVIAYTE